MTNVRKWWITIVKKEYNKLFRTEKEICKYESTNIGISIKYTYDVFRKCKTTHIRSLKKLKIQRIFFLKYRYVDFEYTYDSLILQSEN